MYRTNKVIVLIFFGFFFSNSVLAQQGFSTVAKDANSVHGHINYTIGQVFYQYESSGEGSVTEGLQQTFKITPIIGVEIKNINLSCSIYPNPTVNILTLEVNESVNNTLIYSLVDLNGKILKTGNVNNLKTQISLEQFSKATYYLSIKSDNNILKVFKIVKQ